MSEDHVATIDRLIAEGACRRGDLCCNVNNEPFCLPSPGKLYGVKGVEMADAVCLGGFGEPMKGQLSGVQECDDSSQCGRGERCCSIVLAANDNLFCNDAAGRRDCFGAEPCARGGPCAPPATVCDNGGCRVSRPSDRVGITCGNDKCRGASPICCSSRTEGHRRCAARGGCGEEDEPLSCTSAVDCAAGEFCSLDPAGGVRCASGGLWGGSFLGAICRGDADCAVYARNLRSWLRGMPGGAHVALGAHHCTPGGPYGVCSVEGFN